MRDDADDYVENEERLERMLQREYHDLARIFKYIVITTERTYLCNDVTAEPITGGQQLYFKLELVDAWVWDPYLPTRFLERVQIFTLADVHVEEIKRELEFR